MYKLKDGITLKSNGDNYKIYDKSSEYLGEVDEITYNMLNLCNGNYNENDIVNCFYSKSNFSKEYVDEQVKKALKYLEVFNVIEKISINEQN